MRMNIVICENQCRLHPFLLSKMGRFVRLFTLREAPDICDIIVVDEQFYPPVHVKYPAASLYLGSEENFRHIMTSIGGIPPFESLVFCGMQAKNSVLFSSVSHESAMLCLQRSVVFQNRELEVGEYPVSYHENGSLYDNLVCSFINVCDRMCKHEEMLQRR
jgi:hypothetical protein